MHDPFHPRSTLGAKIIISHPQASASAGVNGTKCIPPTLYIMATVAFALTFNSKRSIGGRPSAGRVQRALRGYRKQCQGDLMTAASVSSQQRRAQQLKRSDW